MPRRGLAAVGFRLLSLAVRQVTLPIGLAGLAMLLEECGGTPVHPGRLIVNGSRTLMCRNMPVLLLLTLAAVGFRLLSLAVRQVTLPIGLAGLAMLLEECGGTLVSLGRLVMSGGPAFTTRDTPVLMLPVLPVRLTHEAKALTDR